MSLQTNDVGMLFDAFGKAYGHQWKQDKDALPMWQKQMKDFQPHEVAHAIDKAIKLHSDYPPTLGQFLNVLRANRPQHGQPALEGPQISATMAYANKVMLKVIGNSGGVSKITLRVMINLKNALTHDFEGKDDDEFGVKLEKELTDLMEGYENQGAEA